METILPLDPGYNDVIYLPLLEKQCQNLKGCHKEYTYVLKSGGQKHLIVQKHDFTGIVGPIAMDFELEAPLPHFPFIYRVFRSFMMPLNTFEQLATDDRLMSR